MIGVGSLGHAQFSRKFFARAIAVCLGLAVPALLGGCGRRGPLELPPSTQARVPEDTAALADKQAVIFNSDSPLGLIQSPNQVVQVNKSAAQLAAQPARRPINAEPVAKPSTFFLDPLL